MDAASTREGQAGEPVLLLVEDNPDDVLLMRRAFRKLGLVARLVVLADGDEAVDYLGQCISEGGSPGRTLPQVLLLDLKLPRRSGHEVLQWIRSQAQLRSLPVVVFTSSTQEEDVAQAYRHGANSYLRKPVHFESLVALLVKVHGYWLSANVTPLFGQSLP